MESPAGALPESTATAHRRALGEVLREREPWLVALAILVAFLAPLATGRTLYFRDLYLQSYPQRRLLVELVHRVGLPLWDPFRHGGQPFLAEPSNVAFYPTALLHFLMPSVEALNLELTLHLAACAFFAHVLARRLGLSRPAATLAGIACALSGFPLSLTNHLNRMLAMPYLAALTLVWDAYAESRRNVTLALAALLGALELAASSPETTVLTFAFLSVWTAALPPRPGQARLYLSLVLVALASASLAAVVILPGSEIVRLSSRAGGTPYALASACSLHPVRLAELVLPGVLGPTGRFAGDRSWGRELEELSPPYVLSIYLGPTLLALAAGSLLAGGHAGLTRRMRTALGVAALASVGLALGKHMPLTRALLETIPPLRIVRFPVKFLTLLTLPLALLAADGLDRALPARGTGRLRSQALLIALALAAVSLAGAAVVLGASPAASAALQRFALGAAREDATRGIAASARHAAAFALGGLGLALLHARRCHPGTRIAFVALTTLDLALAGLPVVPFAPRALLTRRPALAERVLRELGGGRFYRPLSTSVTLGAIPDDDVLWEHVWNQNTLNFALGTAYGIPQVFHFDYDLLAPRAAADLQIRLEPRPWSERIAPLRAAGVTLVMAEDGLAVDGLEALAPATREEAVPGFTLYRLRDPLLPAAFVRRARAVERAEDATDAVLDTAFDPRREVVLEATPGVAGSEQPRAADRDRGSDPSDRTVASPVRLVREAPGSLSLDFDHGAPAAGWVYVARPWAPGWTAQVDGIVAPVVRADAAFQAVAVTAGARRVDLAYRPRALAVGATLSAVTLALLVTLAVIDRRTR